MSEDRMHDPTFMALHGSLLQMLLAHPMDRGGRMSEFSDALAQLIDSRARAIVREEMSVAKAELVKESESYTDAVANAVRNDAATFCVTHTRAIVREELAAVTVSRVYSSERPDGPYRLVREASPTDPVRPTPVEPRPVPRGHCGRCDVCGVSLNFTSNVGNRHARCAEYVETRVEGARTHCAGCGAPYETSGAGPDPSSQTAAGRGPEAPQGEAGASTHVDDEAMRIARGRFGCVVDVVELQRIAAEIRAYRDREVARAREDCAKTVEGQTTASATWHDHWNSAIRCAAKAIRALSAKEPKP